MFWIVFVALGVTAATPPVAVNASTRLPDWAVCAAQPVTKFHRAAATEHRILVRSLLERVDREQRCMQIMAGASKADRPRLWAAIGPVQRAVLRSNAAWLRKQLRRRPLLDIGFSGAVGSEAAWLIVQHADHDPAWQRSVLPTIVRLASANRFDRGQAALLTDRIAVNEGKPQTYGSQGSCGSDGRWHPRPIADLFGTDARRKKRVWNLSKRMSRGLRAERGRYRQRP